MTANGIEETVTDIVNWLKEKDVPHECFEFLGPVTDSTFLDPTYPFPLVKCVRCYGRTNALEPGSV